MKRNTMLHAGAALLLAGASGWAAGQEGESLCAEPGLTILTDAAGDVDGTGIFPAPVPLAHADIVSVQVAQGPQDDGVMRLVFTITLDGALPPVLPPYSGAFTSFKAPNGTFYGVRLATDDTGTASYQSYTVGASNGGQTDGRFADVIKPAESGSASGNTITIVVKGSDIGLRNAGDELKQFNAGSQQGLAPTGVGVLGAVLVGAPDDLSRRGELATETCAASSKSGLERLGGALNLSLLLPLLGFGLFRRRA